MLALAPFLVAATLVAASPALGASEKKVEEYLQAFWTSALWQDRGQTGSSTFPAGVTRFSDGTKLRIAVGGSMGETYRGRVVSQIGPVLAAAKIDFEILPAGQDKDANIELRFVTFSPRSGVPCLTERWPRSGATNRATLDVLDTRVGYCLAHEMMHVIGFVGHPHDSNSVLSYVYNNTDFTEIDRMMVRMLYDPRLKPGMNHLLAVAAARDVLVDLMIVDGAPPETREYGRSFVSGVPTALEKLIAEDRANKTALGEARFQLGVGYSNGYIVAKDEARGYRLFRELIALFPDFLGAQFHIAYALLVGRGTAVNRAESMEWYKKAAARGHAVAQNDLGYYFHWKGEGAEKDLIEAYKWFEIAAERGNERAPGNKINLRKELSDADLQEAVRRAKAWKPALAAN